MFFFALWMEFLGLMLFSLFGNSVTPEFAPAGNGAQMQRVMQYIRSYLSVTPSSAMLSDRALASLWVTA